MGDRIESDNVLALSIDLKKKLEDALLYLFITLTVYTSKNSYFG